MAASEMKSNLRQHGYDFPKKRDIGVYVGNSGL